MEAGVTLTVEQALADVSTALDRAVLAPVMSAADSDLLAALAATPALRNKIDALAARLARAAEQTAAVNRDGSRNAPIWVGSKTGAPPKQVRADVRVARWLVDFGEFAAAHEAGVLGRDHLRVLQHADTPVTHHPLLAAQELLITAARDCTFVGFEHAVQYWVNAVDPDGQLPAEQERSNELSIYRRGDGSVSLKGELDPVTAEIVRNAIEAELEKLQTADKETETFTPRRTQRATALANLCGKGAVRDDGTIAAPLINIVASASVAEAIAEGRAAHIDPNDIDARCEFLDGTPLHPAFLARLMPQAVFRRIIFDAKSRPIDISYNARLFPRWIKEVALVQTRGQCAEHGCDATMRWLQADHKHPHSKGGPTRLDNVQPLCGPGNGHKRDRLPPERPAA